MQNIDHRPAGTGTHIVTVAALAPTLPANVTATSWSGRVFLNVELLGQARTTLALRIASHRIASHNLQRFERTFNVALELPLHRAAVFQL